MGRTGSSRVRLCDDSEPANLARLQPPSVCRLPVISDLDVLARRQGRLRFTGPQSRATTTPRRSSSTVGRTWIPLTGRASPGSLVRSPQASPPVPCSAPMPPPQAKWQQRNQPHQRSIPGPQGLGTPLMAAAYSGKTDIVRLLADKGAKINLCDVVRCSAAFLTSPHLISPQVSWRSQLAVHSPLRLQRIPAARPQRSLHERRRGQVRGAAPPPGPWRRHRRARPGGPLRAPQGVRARARAVR